MTESNYGEATISTEHPTARISEKVIVTQTSDSLRVEVNGIDITYWMAKGYAPAVSFPEGKPPVVTVHLTAEDFEVRYEPSWTVETFLPRKEQA